MYLFDKYNLEFDKATKTSISDKIDGLLQAYGEKSKLNEVLKEYGLNIDTLEHIYYEQEKVNVVTRHLFGNGGSMQVSDTDRIAYYQANYYCYERIYLYTDKRPLLTDAGDYVTDLNGNYQMQDLSDTEKAEKAQLIEDILAELRNGGRSFVALRAEYSEEESVYDYYPDGINVSANDAGTNYPTEFIKAIQGVEVGEYAVCGDGYGYGKYIIARKPLKDFGDLTAQEINMMKSFETYVYDNKSETFFKTMKPTLHNDVMARYDVKKIAQLKYMNI